MNAFPPCFWNPRGPALAREIALTAGVSFGWDRPAASVFADPPELLVLTRAAWTRPDVARHLAGHDVHCPFVHISLSGAGLEALNGRDTPWRAAFWDHLAAAVTLDRLVAVHVLDPAGAERLRPLRAAIAGRFPGMAVV